MNEKTLPENRTNRGILITAWTTILILAMYQILLQEVFRIRLTEDMQFVLSAALVSVGFILTYLWKDIRPLRPFFGLFIVLVVAQWLILARLERLPLLSAWLHHPSFNVYMLTEQGLKLLVTLIVIAALFVIRGRRQRFFLAQGDLSAPARPVFWLGIKPGESWRKIGSRFALFLSLGTLAFLVIAGRPPLDILVRALPFVPAVLLAAVLNAFHEEMTYKASFLAVLEDVVGRRQALWLMAAFFGIFHFYGVPYGIVGVLMATFLGWFLGKSMLETRGFFWAWFLHFCQDVLIFAFLAIGSIQAGG